METISACPDHGFDTWMLVNHFYGGMLSHPRSRSDPIGESEPVSGCETICWDSLYIFFFKAKLISLVYK